MPLIKDGKVTPHGWTFARKLADAPATGDIVLPLMALIEAGEAVFRRAGRVGVALDGDADLGLIAPRLGDIALVTIGFPTFADGRGFSLAHELRQGYRYGGEVWARGYLIPDQYNLARQCGFDGVLVDEPVFARQGEVGWARARSNVTLRYQLSHGADEVAPRSILALRREARQLQAAE